MKFRNLRKLISGTMALALTLSIFSSSHIANASPTKDKAETKVVSEKENKDLQRKVVGYFPEWAYKSEAQGFFDVADLQWDSLTHIQYSFAMIDTATNKITFGDKKAAIEEDFKGHELTHKGKKVELDSKLPYKGHFNLMQVMKKQYPDVDLLMSIGGWAGSRGFYTMLDTDAGINTFADSCVKFIRDYNFDGVDIDFEYPSATGTSGNPDDFDLSEPRRKTINARYNKMMEVLRQKLDKASTEDGKDYLLTAAVTASSWVLGGVSDNSYAKNLDFLSIMSYDFHGGWNEYVENLANIYPDPKDTETTGIMMPVLSMDWAYRYYRGVLPPEKILMGIPYYSRGWENVQGGDGTGLHGKSKTPATGKYNVWGDDLNGDGKLEPAGANPLWHLKNLQESDPNMKVHFDEAGKVPHLWQDKEKVFLSYENEQSIDERVKYIKDKNLGGALIWVMNGDYGANPNYVEGSDKINEGKYTFGDTLTKRLRSGLDGLGNCTETNEGNENLPKVAVDVDFGGVYDHPNYTYSLKVTNHTKEKINGGWTVSFDLPNSAIFKSPWGGTVTTKPNGDFTTITITTAGWQNIEPGATTELQGMIGLCFSGVRNITFNGCNPVGEGGGEIPNNTPPTLAGVNDEKIEVGTSFDKMAGVTASDKEDGDLTKDIKVTGDVDTNKVGQYKLVYEVADKDGLKATANRTIEVVKKDAITDEKPVIKGVSDKKIKLNSKFNAMDGVTASDKEDGDLTKNVKVTGTVDTSKAGNYIVSYSVTDSKGQTTTVSCIVTVEGEKPPTPGDTYDPTKIYVTGDKVIFKGKEYTAKWWVQGQDPDKGGAWELTPEVGADGVEVYVPGKAYSGGSVVSYNGAKYKANWWTNTAPGSDSSWKKL